MMRYTSSSHYGMTVIIRKTLSEMKGTLVFSGTNRPEMFMYVSGRVIVNVDMVRKSVNKF